MKAITRSHAPQGASRTVSRRDADAAGANLALLPPLVRAAASAYHHERGHTLEPFRQRRFALSGGRD